MKRESSKECWVSLLWTNEGFSFTKLSFEEFNLVFFTTESLACFQPTKAPKSFNKPQAHSTLYRKEKYVFNRKFLYLERFHGRFLHFDIGLKEKPQNVPRFEIDFMLNCHVLSRLNLRERIHDPVSVTRISRINLWVFESKISRNNLSFIVKRG